MKHYRGRRDDAGTCVVQVISGVDRLDVRALDLRLDLINHSPTGFEWGYAGSGPEQLALAILADAMGDDKAAVALHQAFKFKVIVALDRHRPWQLSLGDVLKAAVEIAVPCALMRDGNRIFRICGECGGFLRVQGMLVADKCGVLGAAPGVTAEQAQFAAMAHHGRK